MILCALLVTCASHRLQLLSSFASCYPHAAAQSDTDSDWGRERLYIYICGLGLLFLALIVIMGSFQVYSSAKSPAAEKARYYAVSRGKRIGMGLAFLALLAITSFGMLAMQVPLDKFKQENDIVRKI